MKYQRIDNKTYNIHLIKDDKFKKNYISIYFRKETKKEEITLSNLLANVLEENCKKYPTNRLLSIKGEELYGTDLSIISSLLGNYMVLFFVSSFLSPKYSDDKNFEEVLDYTFEILFNPNVENNKFDKKTVELAKENIRTNIKRVNEKKEYYSIVECMKAMDPDGPLSYNGYGYLEDLDKIDESDLYKFYQSFLRSAIVDIFIAGDFDSAVAEKVIKEKFKINTIKKSKVNLFIEHNNICKRVKKIIVQKDFTQSNLTMGFKLKDLTRFEKIYVSKIYNYILGGSVESLLFTDVREKNSLCYSINSNIQYANNAMLINAGISKEKLNKTVKIIKQDIKKIEQGEFDEDKIKSGIQTYLNVISEIDDNIFDICELYVKQELMDGDLIPERIKQIKKVTKEDIINFSKKVHLDTIFFLEGVGKNDTTNN